MKMKQEEWKQAVVRFKEEQDYEKAYKELTSGDSLRTFFLTKSKTQCWVFKEHVCNGPNFIYYCHHSSSTNEGGVVTFVVC